MSLPRRMGLSESAGGLRLTQQIEPAVAALFGAPAPLAGASLPLACRISLAEDFTGSMVLHDGAASRFTVTGVGEEWHLERADAALPFLAARTTLERRAGEGLTLWIDSETIEALREHGTGAASFQHRPATATLRVEADQPRGISVAALA
jgi:hypothetical protein